uniref:Uncharacterized protein n=1 Tax=Trichuris muris TaxID=70415 RepID=A0A5S6Q6D5_TRIMR
MEVRQFTLHWCIENEFEIVVLQPSDDMIQEAAENCEKIGLDRIVEALQAHQWTNLVKKDAGNYSQCVDGERCLGEGLESQAANSDEEKSSSTSFTDLYEQFSSVVAHSKTLSGDQRKEYAAQMVTKFWKSMKVSGCSSLSDLSDGSDIA